MTSTTAHHTVKPKSLTLLELCQTINDLRHTSSRSTAQILTRRLYLHPLTINSNAKQHSAKIINNNLLQIERITQANLEKRNSPRKQKPYRGLAILSSSLPLTARTNTKQNSSIISDSCIDFEASSTTMSTSRASLPPTHRSLASLSNRINLPPITKCAPSLSSSSSKHSVSTRSSYISSHQKPIVNQNDQWEKVDVWIHLARTLQKPTPKDPPTTPLDPLFDLDFDHIQDQNQGYEEQRRQQQQQQQHNFNFIHEIKIFKRNPASDSVINESDTDKED
ncbi:unnamed protein product [Rotaria magnacalcarata]|uniref:Uncharacterized protein n=2 Tax=Rotaria magnacalcarata TaxID=392030 RepID=A0A816QZ28_9BILA|nr:unnamed protein product [Rotaria magnacalcarata]CAF4111104.1 unnamed protein product [Rotaria magnacalcarata]